MKITKIAQNVQPQSAQPFESIQTPPAQNVQPQQTQPQAQNVQPQVDTQMKTLINQADMGSGISKQKALQLIHGLMTAMGEVPLSKVKTTIEIMAQEEIQATQATQAAQAIQAPDQGVTQQTDQTMVQPSG